MYFFQNNSPDGEKLKILLHFYFTFTSGGCIFGYFLMLWMNFLKIKKSRFSLIYRDIGMIT